MDVQTVLHGEGRPKFYFSNNEDDISWSCELARVRCVGHVKNGARCRRNVIKGLDRCWQHTRSELGLKIAPSGVPGAGLGLFTLRARKRGDHICQYLGEVYGPDEFDDRYGTATGPYTVQPNQNTLIDGACKRGVGNFINHAAAANCRFSWSAQQRVMNIRATKNIAAGAELLLNYGGDYRFDEDGVSFRTRW